MAIFSSQRSKTPTDVSQLSTLSIWDELHLSRFCHMETRTKYRRCHFYAALWFSRKVSKCEKQEVLAH